MNRNDKGQRLETAVVLIIVTASLLWLAFSFYHAYGGQS